MNSRWSAIIIVVLLAVSGYFIFQNMQLKKHLRDVESADISKVAPAEPETRPANPPGASPFDKPNIDPVADSFKPIPVIDTFPVTTMKFEHMVYDFGRVNEGDIAKTRFKFVNSGKIVLLISHAKTSCGCTVPTTPKDPIKPGESNYIDVEFNSVGKRGETTKTITLQANTRPIETVLTIKATVIPRDK